MNIPNRFGAGAFLRYAGITSFVLDFLANYGDLEAAKKGTPKPAITITSIDVSILNIVIRFLILVFFYRLLNILRLV